MNRNWYVIKKDNDLGVVSTPPGDTDPLRTRVGWVIIAGVFNSSEDAHSWMDGKNEPQPKALYVKKAAKKKK